MPCVLKVEMSATKTAKTSKEREKQLLLDDWKIYLNYFTGNLRPWSPKWGVYPNPLGCRKKMDFIPLINITEENFKTVFV